MRPTIRATGYKGNLSKFLLEYKTQPKLTKKLDRLTGLNFTPELLNELVLWKVNRYVSLDANQLRGIDKLRKLKPGKHEQAHSVLEDLLKNAHGVGLAMASTFLRFRNPAVFQIIDRHAYRALYGADYKLHSKTAVEVKVNLYFEYLVKLRSLCIDRGMPFKTADRVLYMFDKKKNGRLSGVKNVE